MSDKCLCSVVKKEVSEEALFGVLDFLRVLSDPTRLRILCLVREKELCVCEILETMKLPQNLVSHHLRVLREAGIILSKREGKFVKYSSLPEKLSTKMDEVLFILGINQ